MLREGPFFKYLVANISNYIEQGQSHPWRNSGPRAKQSLLPYPLTPPPFNSSLQRRNEISVTCTLNVNGNTEWQKH
jgi:hypothetical protein